GERPHRLGLDLQDPAGRLQDLVAHRSAARVAPTSSGSRGRAARGSIVGPSDGPRSGASGTSMKSATTPEATAARASPATYWRSPPERVPSPPGSCTEWVASKTTGVPKPRMTARPRKSTTRLL